MTPDSQKLDLLLNIVAQTVGFTPKTPTDFSLLAHNVFEKTGRTIGISTLKRLWGYIKDQTGTSYTTLSLLCRFAGYRDWDNFCDVTFQLEDDRESGFTSENVVESRLLAIGASVSIQLSATKSVVIKKIEQPDRFEIVESNNIKLRPADKLRVACVVVGRPFFASDCWRGGYALGTYTGARGDGVLGVKASE